MRVSVLVLVLVLVEHGLHLAVKGRRNPGQGRQTGQMRTRFEPRDHRLGRAEPDRELLLRFPALRTQRSELLGKARSDHRGRAGPLALAGR
jgi:hypothetical protein